jgi:hypothetical protein
MKIILPIFLMFTLITTAQVTDEGEPISWSYPPSSLEVVQPIVLPTFNLKLIKEQDKINDLLFDRPWRFGYMHSVDFGFEDGKWDVLENGDRIWRLLISSADALSLNFIFDNLFIPRGGTLYLYNDDKTDLLGAYTNDQNQEGGILGTWLVKGPSVWIEYYEPQEVIGQGSLHIVKATHGYRSGDTFKEAKSLNDSGDCNLDVNCSIGSDWEDLKEHNKRSVGILLSGGSGFCTGALINNTQNDGTPYFLTANHCFSNPASWAFRFGWISPNTVCATTESSSSGPTNMTISGATLRARDAGSDFALVEINTAIPEGWDRVFAGWDKSDNFPEFQVGIHHPSGDVMKVCRDDDPATKEFNAGAQTWEIVGGAAGGWEAGVTEPGSSGSPLFDQDGRIIGQLFGGSAACSGTVDNGTLDYYGRLATSWNGAGTSNTRLRDWLDPQNSDSDTMDSFPLLNNFSYDIGVSSIDTPVTGFLSANEVITITVTNYGENPVTNFDLNYQIDSSLLVTETFTGEIPSGQSVQYSFLTTADMSAVATSYQVYSYTSFLSDENSENNSAIIEVIHLNSNDLGISSISAPVSAENLSAAELVSIEITNYGYSSQSDFDVSYEVNGETVTETVAGPLEGYGSSMEYTFVQTIDLSLFGTYEITASVSLNSDAVPSNNSMLISVVSENCRPTADASEGDGFRLFELGTISNVSQGEGYADFTNLSTDLEVGSTNELTVTTGYGNQYIRVWIDFNDDFIFSLEELVVDNAIIAEDLDEGTHTAVLDLMVPENAALGSHLMRAKTNWNAVVPDNACEETEYGETEDYSVNILSSLGTNIFEFQASDLIILSQDLNVFEISLNSNYNSPIDLTVFDLLGHQIISKKLQNKGSGYNFTLDMSYAAKGVYLVRLGNSAYSKVRKIVTQ